MHIIEIIYTSNSVDANKKISVTKPSEIQRVLGFSGPIEFNDPMPLHIAEVDITIYTVIWGK